MKFEHWRGWDVITKAIGYVGVVIFVAMASAVMGQINVVGIQFPTLAPDGTAASPSYAFQSNSALGFRSPQAAFVYLANNAANATLCIGPFGNANSECINGGGGQTTLGSTAQLGWSGGNEQNAVDMNMARGGTTGALRVFAGTAPTCTGNCGTSPSVAGNNTEMLVTIGTGPPAASTFTVTFNGTWTNAPHCQGQRATTGTTPVVTAVVTTTTTAVVNLSANLVASELYSVRCISN